MSASRHRGFKLSEFDRFHGRRFGDGLAEEMIASTGGTSSGWMGSISPRDMANRRAAEAYQLSDNFYGEINDEST